MTVPIKPAVQTCFGCPTVRVVELESTNDLARALARAGVREGAVVVAERQTRGRGRMGRPWASPAGGLWCSLLLRPVRDDGWGLLSLAGALAAAEAIEEVAGLSPGVRWPNDLLVAGRKVAGILIEAAAGAAVVGIGINANVKADDLPAEVAARAGSLHRIAGRPVSVELLLRALLARWAVWYDAWSAADLRLIRAWSGRDLTRGERVRIAVAGAALEGTADGVDQDGALRLREADGTLRRIIAGDLLEVSEP